MQFLERSVFGIRSAIHELNRRDHDVRFLLIPMVHIADASFYSAVNEKLASCDNVIVEGVQSFRTRLITLSYRIPARRKSLGLVLQKDAIRIDTARCRVIHGDVSGPEFTLSLRDVPWHHRFALYVLSSLLGVVLYVAGSRQFVASTRSVDSLPTRATANEAVDDAIVHNRDRRLMKRVEAHILEDSAKDQLTAILFGGSHLPAVASLLMSKHGYRVTKSDWLTAIAI